MITRTPRPPTSRMVECFDRVPSARVGGLAVRATDARLLATLGGTVVRGRVLDAALSDFPTVVLGARAASQIYLRTRNGLFLGLGAGKWNHDSTAAAQVETFRAAHHVGLVGARPSHVGYPDWHN